MFWDDCKPKMNYKIYPFAPRATRNGKILTSLTSWPMTFLACMFWIMLFPLALEAVTGREDKAYFVWAIASSAVIAVIHRYAGKWAWRRLEAQAEDEAEENEHLPALAYDMKVQEVARQSKRFEGWSLIVMCAMFTAVLMHILPLRTVDFRTVSAGDLKYNTVYYADELLVLDGYGVLTSENEQNERKYYLAVFTDKDNKKCFISFFPPKDSRAELLLRDNQSWPVPVKLSAYVLTESIPSTKLAMLWDEETKSFYVPSLSYYYEKARKMYASFASEASDMNAKYICADGESVVWNEIMSEGAAGLVVLVFPLAFLLAGLYMLVKYRA